MQSAKLATPFQKASAKATVPWTSVCAPCRLSSWTRYAVAVPCPVLYVAELHQVVGLNLVQSLERAAEAMEQDSGRDDGHL